MLYLMWKWRVIERHVKAKYENPLKMSENIACVGQRLIYPIRAVAIKKVLGGGGGQEFCLYPPHQHILNTHKIAS